MKIMKYMNYIIFMIYMYDCMSCIYNLLFDLFVYFDLLRPAMVWDWHTNLRHFLEWRRSTGQSHLLWGDAGGSQSCLPKVQNPKACGGLGCPSDSSRGGVGGGVHRPVGQSWTGSSRRSCGQSRFLVVMLNLWIVCTFHIFCIFYIFHIFYIFILIYCLYCLYCLYCFIVLRYNLIYIYIIFIVFIPLFISLFLFISCSLYFIWISDDFMCPERWQTTRWSWNGCVKWGFTMHMQACVLWPVFQKLGKSESCFLPKLFQYVFTFNTVVTFLSLNLFLFIYIYL